MKRRVLIASVAGLAFLAWCGPASAVIRVDFPVSKIYAASKAVLVGTVVGVNAENRLADARVDEAVKGEAGGERFRVQVVSPAAVFQSVAAGQPVVVFVGQAQGKSIAVVHLADTWLLAEGVPGASPPAWRVVQPYDAARSFPGRTVALVRLVAELKAGKAAFQDAAGLEALQGGARELANLKVKPTSLTAADLDGDGKLDLLVGTAAGVRLFLAGAAGYSDATDRWGLAGALGAHCALGDANSDGKPDLLLGPTLWLRGGEGFAKAPAALDLPPEAEWLAAALSDATGDKRADAVVLLKSGKLLILENPGTADGPWPKSSRTLWDDAEAPGAASLSTEWGDDGTLHALVVREGSIVRYPATARGGPAADFPRLTGVPLKSCKGFGDLPSKAVFATPLDYDGNGRMDYLIVTERGGLTLVNRGFGSFLTNSVIHAVFHGGGESEPLPFKLPAIAAVAPGRTQAGKSPRQNLLVLTDDGCLFEMANPEP